MEKMERRMKEMEAHQSHMDFQRKMDEFDRENREAAERSHARWSAPPPPRYNPYGGTEYSNRSSYYRTY
jgi:hypothetical protein